jgi:hypothetical protein
MEVRGQFHALATLPLGQNPSKCLIGCYKGCRAGMDILEEKNLFPPPALESCGIITMATLLPWLHYRIS